MSANSNQEALKAFLDDAKSWLTPADSPAVAMLKTLAVALDAQGAEPSAALANSYGVAYRALLARQPSTSQEEDPLEALLRGRTPTTTNDTHEP